MKKGDLKRQEILQTAESMFCRKGYETTSIQDILDALHTSKGSFYHHYASKEQLLEAICGRRADTVAADISRKVNENLSTIENMNMIFSGFMPLAGEKLTFLMMILPVFDLPEGRQVRFGYAVSLKEAFRDITIRVIRKGNDTGELCCANPEYTAEICFILLNELWYQICVMILRNEKAGRVTDPGEILNMMDAYRTAIERVLSAPFGSILLFDLEDIKFLAEQIHYHWNLQHMTDEDCRR